MAAIGEGVGSYVKAIWVSRYFWLTLVRMDLRTRYRRSVLGLLWSLLHPLAMTAILCAVFSRLLDSDIREYSMIVLSGLAFWAFISAVVRDGCNCLFQGESYIRQYPAPVAIYPLRATLGAGFHFLIALVVVVFLNLLFRGNLHATALVSLLPSLALLFLLGWSLAILAGFCTVYFPDTQHLLEVTLQMLFYATPIMYPEPMLKSRGLGALIQYNPLTWLLHLLRDPILDGHAPGSTTFAVAGVTVLAAGATAVLVLSRLQRRLIFRL
jgi:ABC-type polysaccharide/polyol phosphate export permease